MSGWTMRVCGEITGGQPPTFDDLELDGLEQLREFSDALFADDTEKRWDPKVRELLVMTLLLRFDQFIQILMENPIAADYETNPR